MSSYGDQLQRNTRAMLLSWFVGQIIQVIRLPIFWSFIGPEGVAMWLLGFQVMGFIAFYNIGFDNAYLKYTAEYRVKEDYSRLSELLSTGVAIALLMGGFIFAVLFFLSDSITDTMMNRDTSAANLATFKYIIIVIAATNWYKMVMGVQRAVLSGAQRLDILVYIGLVMNPLELVAMVTAMWMGYGVGTLITIYAIFMSFPTIIMGMFNRRIMPEVRINPMLARFDCIRPLFSLGGRMQALGLVAIVANTLDTLIINKFYGLEFTGSYGTARQLSQRAQGLPRQGLGSLTPLSADLHSREDHKKLSDLYLSGTRVTLLVSAFIFAFAGVNSDYILMIFMDADNFTYIAVQFLIFMSVARIFHTITGAGSHMLRGAGKAGQEMIYQALTIVLFLLFFFPVQIYLSTRFMDTFHLPAISVDNLGVQLESSVVWYSGYTLLLMTFPLSLSLASMLFLFITNRYFRVPMWTPFDKTLLSVAVAILLAVVIRLGWDQIPASVFTFLPFVWDFSRWPSVVSVGCMGILYSALFASATLVLPGLTKDEKMKVLRIVPGGRRILGKYVR